MSDFRHSSGPLPALAELRPEPGWGKFGELVDRVWPHLAAWSLAAMIAFFAVRERLALMEGNAQRHGERLVTLEERDKERDRELRAIREDTTRTRTLLEVYLEELRDERREHAAPRNRR